MNKQIQKLQHHKLSHWLAPALLAATLIISAMAWAQNPASSSAVPPMVNYNGTLISNSGKPLSGVIGVTFTLYKEAQGGAPLWVETQNVQPDKAGHYTVMLGSSTSKGLPSELFASGEPRWLGVQAQGQEELPRVLFISVPYALKAADAETIGGLPPSAFVLAPPANGSSAPGSTGHAGSAAGANPDLSGSGTADFLPLWTDNNGTLGNSVLFQSGTGSKAKVGINTTSPASTLDVKGASTIRGALSLPATKTAKASKGANSQPLDLAASAFNSGTNAAVSQTFQWQSEPVANNTANPSGSLNLLFGSGANAPSETGLNIASTGQITFATGQTFPGTGTITGVTAGTGLTGGGTSGSVSLSLLTSCSSGQVLQWNGSKWVCSNAGTGTITGVTAGTDLTGGGTSGNVTLNLNTTATDGRYAQLNASNTFSGNQTINANGGSTALNVNQNAASGVTYSIIATSRVPTNGDAAILGQELGSAEVFGVQGYISNLTGTGAGVFGSNGGTGVTGSSYKGAGSGVWGDAGFGTLGILGTADNGNSLVGFNNSASYSAIVGENQNKSGSGISPGVAGFSLNSTGIGTLGAGATFSQTFNNGAGAQTIGVVGDTSVAGGIGVWGSSDNGTSVFGSTDEGTGVYGLAPHGIGVYGLSSGGIGIYGETDAGVGEVGVFGAAVTGPDVGVLGTAGSGAFDGAAVEGVADNYQDWGGWFEQDDTHSPDDLAFGAGGPSGGFCNIDVAGDLYCTGDKSAIVPLPDKRWVRLYAMESPENWFEDFGSGTLAHGSASVALEPTFRETVTSSQDYHVFLTPKGDCKGLYVTGESATGFEVRELGGGKSDIAFDYRIVVRRKGYENIRMEDATKVFERNVAMAQRTKKLALRKEAPIKPVDRKPAPPIQMPIAPRPTLRLRANNQPTASLAQPVPASTKR